MHALAKSLQKRAAKRAKKLSGDREQYDIDFKFLQEKPSVCKNRSHESLWRSFPKQAGPKHWFPIPATTVVLSLASVGMALLQSSAETVPTWSYNPTKKSSMEIRVWESKGYGRVMRCPCVQCGINYNLPKAVCMVERMYVYFLASELSHHPHHIPLHHKK